MKNEQETVLGIGISNPQKIIFPDAKISKLEVAKYYEKIAPIMMPFLDRRLLSVIRCHGDINCEKFFKKHPTNERNVSRYMVGEDEYFYVKNAKEIVYQAQMGTVEFHTWGSKITALDRPDLMVFDLDPNDDVSLKKLRNGVKHLKSVLDELKLPSFLKTSGGKGYHVVVPFSKMKDWSEFGEFSKRVALLMEARWPDMFTSNIRKAERKGRIFVDYLRNKKGATCVAPYSLRARKGAPISFPIRWENLDEITPNEVNLKNVGDFMTKTNPWQQVENRVLK